MYITDNHELDDKMGTKLSVFQKIFHGLENCDEQRRWLVRVDPLEIEW